MSGEWTAWRSGWRASKNSGVLGAVVDDCPRRAGNAKKEEGLVYGDQAEVMEMKKRSMLFVKAVL